MFFLNILRNKILFILSRCEYNDNAISFIKIFIFIKTLISRFFNSQLFIILKKIFLLSFFFKKRFRL